MDSLPDEIWAEILDYLDSNDIVSVQRISKRLQKLAHDNSLWRYKCFEKSPSASTTGRLHTLAALTGALGGLSLSDPTPDPGRSPKPSRVTSEPRSRISKRAQAVSDWDCSTEKVDWYSEYIARNASLSTQWLIDGKGHSPEIRGIVAFPDSSRAVGPRENGSLCVWDIVESANGKRKFRQSGQTAAGALFEEGSSIASSSGKPSRLSFSGVTDCISLDSIRNRAFVAIDRFLKEVDLDTLKVVSQHVYAWPITALAQESALQVPLTVGTTWSLNLYDPRVPMRDRSRSPEDMLRSSPADPEDSIAFLPNYMKNGVLNRDSFAPRPMPPPQRGQQPPPVPTLPQSQPMAGILLSQPQQRNGRRDITDYARIEPGPLSILHQGQNDIFIAGRFPSILAYDRRYFPRLQNAIHSGARLSQIASTQYPPPGAKQSSGAEATLVACGEYGGRGSLELYSLPHIKQEVSRTNDDYGLANTAGDLGAADREHAMFRAFSEPEYPFSYKNRVSASASKLFSVASQGTRIVFSDAEGGLKWVERDGRGLARRWNINNFEVTSTGASVQGEQVVRRIIPLNARDSDRGVRGDGDLLIWTGERVGIVTTKQNRDEDELAQAFDQKMNLNEDDEKIEAHAQVMRRALERQADERIFMRRFT